MKEIFENILKSFNTKREGYSSRKLTAFVIVVLVIITHIKWLTLGDFSQLEMVLSIDYAFIAALFGMTTYHSIKRNGGKDEEVKKDEPENIEGNIEENIG
jgi:hypothetical protein